MNILPNEVLSHICKFLMIKDRVSFSATSTIMYNAVHCANRGLITWYKQNHACLCELPKWYKIGQFKNCFGTYSTARRTNRYTSYEFNTHCGLFILVRFDDKKDYTRMYIRNK